jgi:hypothetical protein
LGGPLIASLSYAMSGRSRYANGDGSDFSEIVGAEDLESPTREYPQKGKGLRAVLSLQALAG